MDNTRLDALLAPSLDKHSSSERTFSVTAHILVAWLGGAIAVSIFSMYGLSRMGVLKGNTVIPIALLAFSFLTVMIALAFALGVLDPAIFLADTQLSTADVRVFNRIVGMAVFGIFYLCHKKYFQASDISSSDPPNPWGPGIISVILAIALSALPAIAITALAQQ